MFLWLYQINLIRLVSKNALSLRNSKEKYVSPFFHARTFIVSNPGKGFPSFLPKAKKMGKIFLPSLGRGRGWGGYIQRRRIKLIWYYLACCFLKQPQHSRSYPTLSIRSLQSDSERFACVNCSGVIHCIYTRSALSLSGVGDIIPPSFLYLYCKFFKRRW